MSGTALGFSQPAGKIGMDGGDFTAESSADELLAAMTLENFAKFEDTDVEEFKKKYGIEKKDCLADGMYQPVD